MALDTGKRKVLKKTIDTQVPYVPAKSYASIAFDSLKPTIDRIQADQEKTAQANYFFDFQIKTRDYFDSVREEFKFDADGMKAAVDTYSKTLMEQVPPKYKIQAGAMLANYSMSSINYAATNKNIKDKNDKLGMRDKNYENFNSETEFSMNTFTKNKFDVGTVGINSNFVIGLLSLNELLHEDFENLVKTDDLSQKSHQENMETQLKDLAISRGFNIMKLMYNNGMEAEALNWLKDYAQGEDKTPIDSEKIKDNPVYKELNRILGDTNDRAEIVNKIKKLYNGFHHDNFIEKAKKPNVDLEFHKQPGQMLSLENFKGGAVDANSLALTLGVEIGSTQHTKLQEYVAEANNAARVVAMTMQNPDQRINWEDEGVTPELWAKSILAMNGIHKVRFSDLNSDGFKTAINIFAKQDYYPPELESALKISPTGDWKDESTLKHFANQTLIYDYVKELFPNVEFPPLYEQALELGAIDEIANENYSVAASIMNGIKDEHKNTRLQSIVLNEDSNKKFDDYFKANVKSPNWIAQMFAGGIDEMNKNLFAPSDQTTFFAIDPSEIMPPAAKDEMKNMFFETIANYTHGTDIDPWKKGNEKILKKAWNITTNRMKQAGWGVETSTWDGKPRLVKNPYLHTYGEPNDNDIYAHVKKSFMMAGGEPAYTEAELTEVLNKGYVAEQNSKLTGFGFDNKFVRDKKYRDEQKALMKKWYAKYDEMKKANENLYPGEKESIFGTNNWDDVQKMLNLYFDDKQGKVKIAIDKQSFNDANGFPAYELSIWEEDYVITLDGNFKPAGWQPTPGNNETGSLAEYKNSVANQIYETFKDSTWYQKLPGDDANWTKRAIHSIIRNSISLSDYRFYPDIPGLDDQPKEVKPFAWIARMIGFDGDLREIQTELNLAANIAKENYTYQEEINANRDLTNTEKVIEALMPPEKMIMNNNAMGLQFKHYALKNYNNSELRLTHRTNNWMAVSSADWDGELPLNYHRDSRHVAVFSHPKQSIRAAVKTILNHSSLTVKANDVVKLYGSEPTIREILTMYAKDTKSYLEALDRETNMDPDQTVNIMNANQMHQLIKFMIQHEMGFNYYEEKFGITNAYVDSVIFTGFNEAIHSYNGQLGELYK